MRLFPTFRRPAAYISRTCDEVIPHTPLLGPLPWPAVITCTRPPHGTAVWHFDSAAGVTWRPRDGKGDWLR